MSDGKRRATLNRSTYLDIAASGVRMPIGADLVLHEQPDSQAVLTDGTRLGQVIVETARRYRTPLALPLMDLMVEKAELLKVLGLGSEHADTYHFAEPPAAECLEVLRARQTPPLTARLQANVEAVRHVSARSDLIPCGLAIGPFSLMTKLLADPIMPVYSAGTGLTAEDDPQIHAVERCLALATEVIRHSVLAQIEAGARLIVLAEPAANTTYLSPRQLARGADTFERYVMMPNRSLRETLTEAGVDLMLHDCGELTDGMLTSLAYLDPAIISLGSSRRLWEDASLVPDNVVLFGNLPTKRFYSDELSKEDVAGMARETVERVRATGHAHILGSECDVLSVPGKHKAISAKVEAFMA